MAPKFSELDEPLDNMEEKVMEVPDTSFRQDITTIKKQAIIFRRYVSPQHNVLSALRTSDQPWLGLTRKRRLQESLDRVIRYVEEIDTIRERAQIVKSVDSWHLTLEKPAFNPPNWVFGPVWTAIYALMAIAAWRIERLAGWLLAPYLLWVGFAAMLNFSIWTLN